MFSSLFGINLMMVKANSVFHKEETFGQRKSQQHKKQIFLTIQQFTSKIHVHSLKKCILIKLWVLIRQKACKVSCMNK